MQWKPSLIAMDAINAIIVKPQSAHKTSLSNMMRKAVAISLKATRRPCQQTQKHHEGVVSITTILIPQQQLSSQERQLLQCKHNRHKKETLYAGNLRQIGLIHAPDLLWQTWDQQQNSKNELASRTKKRTKTKAVLTGMPCFTRTKIARQAANQVTEPVTPSPVTKKQARATTTRNTILAKFLE
jgi:hypothetical protein